MLPFLRWIVPIVELDPVVPGGVSGDTVPRGPRGSDEHEVGTIGRKSVL